MSHHSNAVLVLNNVNWKLNLLCSRGAHLWSWRENSEQKQQETRALAVLQTHDQSTNVISPNMAALPIRQKTALIICRNTHNYMQVCRDKTRSYKEHMQLGSYDQISHRVEQAGGECTFSSFQHKKCYTLDAKEKQQARSLGNTPKHKFVLIKWHNARSYAGVPD